MANKTKFQKELEALINKHSIENKSGTPDWILAQYLMRCLDNFTITTEQRMAWWGDAKKNE